MCTPNSKYSRILCGKSCAYTVYVLWYLLGKGGQHILICSVCVCVHARVHLMHKKIGNLEGWQTFSCGILQAECHLVDTILHINVLESIACVHVHIPIFIGEELVCQLVLLASHFYASPHHSNCAHRLKVSS